MRCVQPYFVTFLALTGCFGAPSAASPDDPRESEPGTSGGMEDDASSSSPTEAEPETGSTSGTTGSIGTDGATSSSGSDESSSSGCTPGELGCECEAQRIPCEGNTVCIDGFCEEDEAECLVSYGGSDGNLRFSVTSVRPQGELKLEHEQSFAGDHEIDDDIAGQDMLTQCGDTFYAVVEGGAEVLALRMETDRSLTEVQRFPVPAVQDGDRRMRALECADPEANFVIGIALYHPPSGANIQVRVHAFARADDGTLSFNDDPLILPWATSFEPRRVRTAWSPTRGFGYVGFDNPQGNNFAIVSFSLQAQTGILNAGPAGPSFVNGLRAWLGALAINPDEDTLGLAGVQIGGSGLGATATAPLQADNAPGPLLASIGDTPTETLHATARSLVFETLEGSGPSAIIASDGEVGFFDLGAEPLPLRRAVFSRIGTGQANALVLHEGRVLVVADQAAVFTYDATLDLEQIGNAPLSVVRLDVPGYTDSVAAACPR